MNRTIFLCLIMLVWCGMSDAQNSPVSHQLFDTYLKSHVADNRVNYTDACRDVRLDDYLEQMSLVVPEQLPSDKFRMAFWINLYNAGTIRLICDYYPVASINDIHKGGLIIGSVIRQTAWDRKFIKSNGKVLSLNQVEHDILRPVFKDPRIHFAIVCAAKGCPPLRAEAYSGEQLDAQLDEQGRFFLSDKEKNRFDSVKRRADLSPIFSWFKKDFGRNNKEVLRFVARFVGEGFEEALRQDDFNWALKYTEYDWSLNDRTVK